MARRFPPLPLSAPPSPGERTRIGIVSGFFRRHSNWKVPVRGWLRTLSRDRFQILGYHTGAQQDEATDEARALCDRFVQGPFRIERWREEIAADAPHVLIWPEIGMDPVAARLAAQRLAPTQCTTWGQPVTSGFPTLDWFISSDLMEAPEADAHYTERLLRLPGLGAVCQPTPPCSLAVDRASFGLDPEAVVFWCGQSLPKFLPEYDWVFPAIAAAAPAAQFLFIEHQHGTRVNAVFRARLRAAFNRAGLDAERHCRLVPHMGKERFMHSLAASDALLDAIGWAGCNTALEALAHDLPILTHAGPFLRGRHGVAILRRMEMPETIACTPDGLVSLAARLARDPTWRAALRRDTAARKHRVFHDAAVADALAAFLDHAARTPACAAS